MERAFATLDRLEAPDLRDDVDRRRRGAVEPRPIPPPRRDGRRAFTAVVAIVVFAVGAFGLRAWERNPTVVSPRDPWSWAHEGWTELPAPPEWRDGAAIVWTGSELLYWGGASRGSDRQASSRGFAFDPATRVWRSIAPADLPGTNAKGVWTGQMALFWGFSEGSSGFGMQGYEPATDTWYLFPSPPHDPTWGGTYAWTGSELIVFGGGAKGSPNNVDGSAFDPRTGQWHPIADAPLGLNLVSSAWTGTSLIVVGSLIDDGRHATTETSVAIRYDPSSDTWTRLPDPPVSPQTADVTLVGGALLAWEDYTPAGAEYLPDTHSWRSIDTGDLTPSECYAQGAPVEDALLAWNCGRPAAWFASSGTWLGLSRPIEPTSPQLQYDFGWTYSAGTAAIVDQIESIDDRGTFVGSPDAPEHLWLWRPPAAPPARSIAHSTDDAGDLVATFIGDWAGARTFLRTIATATVIDRYRTLFGGISSFETDPDHFRVRFGGIEEVSPGSFEVPGEQVVDGRHVGAFVFTVGAGTTADGRDGSFVITDVRAT
jgi:hypothetical protein